MEQTCEQVANLDLHSEGEDSDYSDEDSTYYVGPEDSAQALKAATSSGVARHSNQQHAKESTFQPSGGLQQKYIHKISVRKYEYQEDERRGKDASKTRVKDKEERATVENVLDSRTKMILFKMLNRGAISEIEGCISTGKEANVYFASHHTDDPRAVKIYKTSILIFKDRDKYVSGDFRFRHGYCRHNPRKMVQTWAEKEFRNLSRIFREGIPCPEPLILRSHVLVMKFIGKNCIPAPLLKNVDLSKEKYCELYLDCLTMMRDLYTKCKLIHADLSEYNVLYHEGKMVLIDVSQSVEPDHPHSMDFLRKDCINMTDFFKKRGVEVISVRKMFDFVTTTTNVDSLNYLEEVLNEKVDPESIEDEVFKQAYLPKRLDEVIDAERDIFDKKGEDTHYRALTELNADHETSSKPEEESASDESDSESSSTEEDENGEKTFKSCRRPRDESPNSKKERKKLLKEARKEKQKTKIKKHAKKRKEKLGANNKKKN
ncbi:hypothetical protein JTE90_029007 [Oedothorax gibbosus]|uniref:Serine/threonine-protein kinase RIO1 n=1 Tax=Oedothorax gibbosus TaxID=931172 RepID=A0AAV6VJE7_9ARAC|nr:hypothetical protein JTE90_029007 [Oedothorax gibbosus]